MTALMTSSMASAMTSEIASDMTSDNVLSALGYFMFYISGTCPGKDMRMGSAGESEAMTMPCHAILSHHISQDEGFKTWH